MKTFRDVYTFPLRLSEDGWIYDQNNYFVAQAMIPHHKHKQQLVDIINGNVTLKTELQFSHSDGIISSNTGRHILRIRGWGNLTGTGGLNLSHEEACNIQDTFAEFIVSQLNKCRNH